MSYFKALRLKCTKFDFRWGSAQTPLAEITVLPRLPSWIQWVLFLREGEGRRDREKVTIEGL